MMMTDTDMAKRTYGAGGLYKRGKVWWIKYRAGEKPTYESSRSSDKKVAAALLRQRLAEADQGEVPPGHATVADLLNLMEREYERLKRKSLPQFRSRRKRLDRELGSLRAERLTRRMVENYADTMLEGGFEPATANRELEVLRRAYRRGREEDPPWVRSEPKIRMLPVDNVRQGFLEPEQYERLRDALRDPIRLLFIIAYHVGARPGSILSLDWNRVDLVRRVVRPPTDVPKNKRVGVWPIYGDMLRALHEAAIIQERDWPNVDLVIHRSGRKVIDYRKAWKSGLALAGLDSGLLLHDMRRSAARNLRRAGLSEHEAMQVTGHRTNSMYQRYAIISERDVQRSAERLDKWATREMRSGDPERVQ